MANAIPKLNYVGKLQETCLKLNLSRPEFDEDSYENYLLNQFKCSCKVGKWTSIGEGYSKKGAKQNAAKKVIDLIENENIQELKEKCANFSDKAVTMLATYCVKENAGVPPLYSEKPKDDDLFVIECTFKEFSAIGKGKNKKSAKENAAELVAQHFKLYQYYRTLGETNKRRISLKNPLQILNELAQRQKLEISFSEKILSNNMYVFTCHVGGKESKSSVSTSKKSAKMEAAESMLKMLNSHSPDKSLATPPLSEGGDASSGEDGDNSVRRKRAMSQESSNESSSGDDEPPYKKISLQS